MNITISADRFDTVPAISTKKKVLLLNMPAKGLVHRDVGCAYTSKSNYYFPQADIYIFGGIVKPFSNLSYLDCVANVVSVDDMLAQIKKLQPDHIFTMISSISEWSDLQNLKLIRSVAPSAEIWATGDLIFYSDREFDDIDHLVKDFTNTEAILDVFLNGSGGKKVVPRGGDRCFKVGICPHEFSLNSVYHMPYSLHAPVAMMLTNWGCPFHCTFCAARNLHDNGKYKHRDVDETIAEIRYILSLGFKEIYFRDFTFAIPRCEKLVDEIINSGLKFRWSCATRVDVVNKRLLEKMHKAGCYLIFYGVDAADNEILKRIRKDLTVEEVAEVVAATKSCGIEVLTSFIVGWEGEDREKTKRFILDIDPDFLSVSMLKPTHGSTLRDASNLWDENALLGEHIDSTFSEDKSLVAFRNDVERSFYLRPRKIISYVRLMLKGPQRTKNFFISGMGLAKKWITGVPVKLREAVQLSAQS